MNSGGQACVEDDSWNVGLRSTSGGEGEGPFEFSDVQVPVGIAVVVVPLLCCAYFVFVKNRSYEEAPESNAYIL